MTRRRPRSRPTKSARPRPVYPAIQRIHDLLYLDMEGGREFWNAEKHWDSDTIEMVAEIVAEYIPRPPTIEPQAR